jgi:hypothetical protein
MSQTKQYEVGGYNPILCRGNKSCTKRHRRYFWQALSRLYAIHRQELSHSTQSGIPNIVLLKRRRVTIHLPKDQLACPGAPRRRQQPFYRRPHPSRLQTPAGSPMTKSVLPIRAAVRTDKVFSRPCLLRLTSVPYSEDAASALIYHIHHGYRLLSAASRCETKCSWM